MSTSSSNHSGINGLLVHKSIPNYKSEKWLAKFGWERGKGLGKEEQGRLDYIKVSKKDNTLGVRLLGKSNYQVKDFQWWDEIYKNASQKINISTTNNGEVVLSKEEIKEPSKIETTIYSGLFVSGGTMDDERKAIQTRQSLGSNEEIVHESKSSDGRRSRQEGKLSRLQEQDEAMKAHIDAHKRRKVDTIFQHITETEKKKQVESDRKEEKKKDDRRKEKNKRREERRKNKREKKRRRDEMDSESEILSEDGDKSDLEDHEPLKKKRKTESS